MKIAIIGAGGWGTTVAELLGKKGFETTLWSHSNRVSEAIKRWKENIFYLKGIKLNHIKNITTDISEALDKKDIIILAVPSQKLRSVIKNSLPKNNPLIINLAKGIENGSNKRMSEVISETWSSIPKENIMPLSGPNFAIEIAQEMPAATVIGGSNEKFLKEVQKALSTPYFRVYYTFDITGVELGGSLKNVLAISAGISDGLGFGDSSKSSLIVRGISELVRFGTKLGGKKETFYGLSGIGDLVATSFSKNSRNRWAGEEIGKGRTKEEIEELTTKVVEGMYTVKSIYEIKQNLQIYMPITDATYKIIYKNEKPLKALQELMQRPLKKEDT
jgi:glycerol-3-phosphate dehydrogenase (NAD(P)+)